MVTYISQFFTSLLGIALPEIVFILFGLAIAYIVLRSFFSIFGVNTKILDFVFYVSVVFIAVAELGGFEWTFSLLS